MTKFQTNGRQFEARLVGFAYGVGTKWQVVVADLDTGRDVYWTGLSGKKEARRQLSDISEIAGSVIAAR